MLFELLVSLCRRGVHTPIEVFLAFVIGIIMIAVASLQMQLVVVAHTFLILQANHDDR